MRSCQNFATSAHSFDNCKRKELPNEHGKDSSIRTNIGKQVYIFKKTPNADKHEGTDDMVIPPSNVRQAGKLPTQIRIFKRSQLPRE